MGLGNKRRIVLDLRHESDPFSGNAAVCFTCGSPKITLGRLIFQLYPVHTTKPSDFGITAIC